MVAVEARRWCSRGAGHWVPASAMSPGGNYCRPCRRQYEAERNTPLPAAERAALYERYAARTTRLIPHAEDSLTRRQLERTVRDWSVLADQARRQAAREEARRGRSTAAR